jgi:uncharacterized protein (TIGR03083 family)
VSDEEIVAASQHNRLAFADLLESLTDDQLATQSLCGKWDCATVGAHLAAAITARVSVFGVALVRNLGNFDKANDQVARRQAEGGVAKSITTIRLNAGSRFAPPGTGVRAPLADVLIHIGDIVRPLGLPHEVPDHHVRIALGFFGDGRAMGFVKRGSTDGLSFAATDLNYTFGNGPVIAGRGIDLMMAMTGRTIALADLDGPGVAILRQRLG